MLIKNTLLDKTIVMLVLGIGFSLHAMEIKEGESKKIRKYVRENKNSPERLGCVLIEMAGWEKPDLGVAEKIFKLGGSANAKNKGDIWENWYGNAGSTILTRAAYYGKTEYVQFLLDHDADIEIKSLWDGRTALMNASLNGHNDTLALLISRSANVNAKNCSGITALIWAADHGHTETVKILLGAKADVHCRDEYGDTALKRAKLAILPKRKKRYKNIVSLLEQVGATE